MSSRSGYYAGRGPKTCDLNSEHLEMLWNGIRDDVGATAASEFVRMVEELEDMSASAFLVSFETYFCAKFRWRHRPQQKDDRNALSGRGDGLIGEAMGLLGEAMFGGGRNDPAWDRNESWNIKAMFLSRHSTKVTKRPKDFHRGLTTGYYCND